MNFLPLYQEHFQRCLTVSQYQTLTIVVWLLQVQKQVRIERLASCFPLPILYESRRKHIQRFLALPKFSIPLFWFPLIQTIINQQFPLGSRLIIALDRTQWKENNLLVASVIWHQRALPIYWHFLGKDGCSNLAQQQATIRPVLQLLKDYEIVLIGDREFHSVHLAYWLRTRRGKVYFALRQKQDTYVRRGRKNAQTLRSLALFPGKRLFLTGIGITKKKGFGKFNLAGYYKRKYKGKQEKEPWYILTNLTNLSEVLKVYRTRMGIEAMFKDCKTGGYNLEDSLAKPERLNTLILLIAIAYTSTALKGKLLKQQGHQKYIARLKEAKRNRRRHSNFWVGLYGLLWVITYEYCCHWVEKLMTINPQKLSNYQKGLKARFLLQGIV